MFRFPWAAFEMLLLSQLWLSTRQDGMYTAKKEIKEDKPMLAPSYKTVRKPQFQSLFANSNLSIEVNIGRIKTGVNIISFSSGVHK